jgi:predicted metal-dependent peptidase
MIDLTNLSVQDRIMRAKVRMYKKSPFFSYILLHMKLIKENTFCPTMAVDINGNIYYNEDWVSKLTDEEIMGVLAHETLHCLTPDMVVGTKDLKIGEVREHDMIIGADGNTYPIEKTESRYYKGNILNIKARGMLPLKITPNHRVLTINALGWKTIDSKREPGRTNIRILSKRKWKNSQDLTTEDYLICPKMKWKDKYKEYVIDTTKYIRGNPWSVSKQLQQLKLDEDVAFFLGLFTANGWTDKNLKSDIIGFAISKRKEADADRIKAIGATKLGISGRKIFHKAREQEEGIWRVMFGNRILQRLLRNVIGTYAHNKTIPDWIFYNPDIAIVKSYLKGLYSGDGWNGLKKDSCNSNIGYCTVNKELALKLQRLLTRIDCFGGLFEREGTEVKIFGKVYTKKEDTHDQYILLCRGKPLFDLLGFEYNKSRPTKYHIDLGDAFATKIINIKTDSYEGEVFNIRTPCKNYTVNNLAVHNCAFQHMDRGKLKDHMVFNIANDLVNNSILQEQSFTLPESGCIPDRYQHSFVVWGQKIEKINEKCSEEIYEELYKMIPKRTICIHQPNNNPGSGNGNNQPQHNKTGDKTLDGFDVHIYGPNKDTEKNGTKGEDSDRISIDRQQKWKEVIAEAVQVAKQQGLLPAGLERLVEGILDSKINWKQKLYKYVVAQIINDFSWSRPSKRGASLGIYLPSTTKESVHIVVSIDTSGSIGDNELREFLSELMAIGDAFVNLNIDLIICDAAVHETYQLTRESIDTIAKLKMSGGGGTSHVPIYKFVEENIQDCRVLLNFTDGATTFPTNTDYTFNSLWVLCKGGVDPKNIPFGEVIQLGN